MIIRLGGHDGVLKASQCTVCTIEKLDDSQPLCSVCAAMLHAVAGREWFKSLHEEWSNSATVARFEAVQTQRANTDIECLYRCQHCPWPIYRTGFNGVRPIWSHAFSDGKRRGPWPRTLCEDAENRVLGEDYHATPIWDELISESDRQLLRMLGIERS